MIAIERRLPVNDAADPACPDGRLLALRCLGIPQVATRATMSRRRTLLRSLAAFCARIRPRQTAELASLVLYLGEEIDRTCPRSSSSPSPQSMAVFLNGDAITEPDPHGRRIADDSFLLLVNTGAEGTSFDLPGPPYDGPWEVVLDTSQTPERAGAAPEEPVRMVPYSLCLLRRTAGSQANGSSRPASSSAVSSRLAACRVCDLRRSGWTGNLPTAPVPTSPATT